MNITIQLHQAVYAIITAIALVYILFDVFREYGGGGYFSSRKYKGQLGFPSAIMIILWFIFSLIWGGFFWW